MVEESGDTLRFVGDIGVKALDDGSGLTLTTLTIDQHMQSGEGRGLGRSSLRGWLLAGGEIGIFEERT